MSFSNYRNSLKNFFRFGLLLAILSVVFGAMGAHALKEVLTESELTSFQTGVRYQFFHAIAIIFFSFFFNDPGEKHSKRILLLMSLGVSLFSFSIYALIAFKVAYQPIMSILGPITPLGGTVLIFAWTYMLIKSGDIWEKTVKKRDK